MYHNSVNAEKLKELRMERGETKKVAAKGAGVSSRTLYSYERGRVKRPDKKTVQKLADYYGVGAPYFMYEDN